MSDQQSVEATPTMGILRKQIITGVKMSLSKIITPNFESKRNNKVRINDKASIHDISAKQSDVDIDELDFRERSGAVSNGKPKR